MRFIVLFPAVNQSRLSEASMTALSCWLFGSKAVSRFCVYSGFKHHVEVCVQLKNSAGFQARGECSAYTGCASSKSKGRRVAARIQTTARPLKKCPSLDRGTLNRKLQRCRFASSSQGHVRSSVMPKGATWQTSSSKAMEGSQRTSSLKKDKTLC